MNLAAILINNLQPRLNKRGTLQWRFGLASKMSTVFAPKPGSSTIAGKSPTTACSSHPAVSLAPIFGVLVPLPIPSRLMGHLFAIKKKLDALKSISRGLKGFFRPICHGQS